jgi:hypothetical protein
VRPKGDNSNNNLAVAEHKQTRETELGARSVDTLAEIVNDLEVNRVETNDATK